MASKPWRRWSAAAGLAGAGRAAEALTHVAEWTGVGLRSLVNVFNPDVVVIGGSLGQIFAAASDRILDEIHRSVAPSDDLQVRVAGLGQDSALLGAAEQAFSGLLRDPAAASA